MNPVKRKKGIIMLIVLIVLMVGAAAWWMKSQVKDERPDAQQDVSYRSSYHFTTPDKWKNDPQKPVYHKGKYHYYYLYNKDYPDGNGTEWRHAVSEDLIHWEDQGVAIPKYTNENGDPWSGSVVIDRENTAGFGKGAFIAIVTQPTGETGEQEQYMWVSTDDGKTFENYSDEPVLKNPGTKDFRDPKIVWDDERDKWIMLMAEGSKVGFYESENLKDWTFTGDFQTSELGVLECPDLFKMKAPDGTVKWVLGVSANGEAIGEPNTYAYWTGEFNGSSFDAYQSDPQWLDYGFDWYGGVTFEDGKAEDKEEKRYAFAWMNKWSYADNTPTMENDGFNGTDSIVREIRLDGDAENGYYLASEPIEALDGLVESTKTFKDMTVEDEMKKLDIESETYRIEADISWEDAEQFGFRLRESEDQSRHIDAGISLEGDYSYLNRRFTDQPDREGTFEESKAPFDSAAKRVHVTIFVDKTSAEMFIDDGRIVHTNLVFPRAEDRDISLFSDGGRVKFEKLEVKKLSSNR